MAYTISPIPEFNDNYIWLIGHDKSRSAIIVDPGASCAVNEYCEKNNWQPSAIWITHHHQDHIGGVEELVKRWNCTTYGPKLADEKFTVELADNDTIDLFGQNSAVRIIATPGHTKDHICYFSELGLFCGDTLFAGGCGRAFECDPAILHASLQKLAKLPRATKVYAAHEYTLNNLQFAQTVDPNNQKLIKRSEDVRSLREKKLPTLPSNIGLELDTNPFMRCNEAAIRGWAQAIDRQALDTAAIFTRLRQAKDAW